MLGVKRPSASSPASSCIFGPVPATYSGGQVRGVTASSRSAGTLAVYSRPSKSSSSPLRIARTISRLSRIAVSGRAGLRSPSPISFMKIFEAPNPSRKRPSPPMASWVTRASIAT